MEIHRHPALTRMWAPVGQQPEVPAPGKNEKKVVYGGVDYQTGRLTYTVADTKCGGSFLAFLVALLLAYAGKKIRLVCDNGRFHTTQPSINAGEPHRLYTDAPLRTITDRYNTHRYKKTCLKTEGEADNEGHRLYSREH